MPIAIVAPGKTRLGWIGTGVMGRSMCGHLIDRGFAMTVFSRTKAKADALIAKGAKWAESPKAVAEQSDVVFTIVGFPADVREIVLGPHGALAGSQIGDGSGRHDDERAFAGYRNCGKGAERKEYMSIDAPVSGGDVGAERRGCRS